MTTMTTKSPMTGAQQTTSSTTHHGARPRPQQPLTTTTSNMAIGMVYDDHSKPDPNQSNQTNLEDSQMMTARPVRRASYAMPRFTFTPTTSSSLLRLSMIQTITAPNKPQEAHDQAVEQMSDTAAIAHEQVQEQQQQSNENTENNEALQLTDLESIPDASDAPSCDQLRTEREMMNAVFDVAALTASTATTAATEESEQVEEEAQQPQQQVQDDEEDDIESEQMSGASSQQEDERKIMQKVFLPFGPDDRPGIALTEQEAREENEIARLVSDICKSQTKQSAQVQNEPSQAEPEPFAPVQVQQQQQQQQLQQQIEDSASTLEFTDDDEELANQSVHEPDEEQIPQSPSPPSSPLPAKAAQQSSTSFSLLQLLQVLEGLMANADENDSTWLLDAPRKRRLAELLQQLQRNARLPSSFAQDVALQLDLAHQVQENQRLLQKQTQIQSHMDQLEARHKVLQLELKNLKDTKTSEVLMTESLFLKRRDPSKSTTNTTSKTRRSAVNKGKATRPSSSGAAPRSAPHLSSKTRHSQASCSPYARVEIPAAARKNRRKSTSCIGQEGNSLSSTHDSSSVPPLASLTSMMSPFASPIKEQHRKRIHKQSTCEDEDDEVPEGVESEGDEDIAVTPRSSIESTEIHDNEYRRVIMDKDREICQLYVALSTKTKMVDELTAHLALQMGAKNCNGTSQSSSNAQLSTLLFKNIVEKQSQNGKLLEFLQTVEGQNETCRQHLDFYRQRVAVLEATKHELTMDLQAAAKQVLKYQETTDQLTQRVEDQENRNRRLAEHLRRKEEEIFKLTEAVNSGQSQVKELYTLVADPSDSAGRGRISSLFHGDPSDSAGRGRISSLLRGDPSDSAGRGRISSLLHGDPSNSAGRGRISSLLRFGKDKKAKSGFLDDQPLQQEQQRARQTRRSLNRSFNQQEGPEDDLVLDDDSVLFGQDDGVHSSKNKQIHPHGQLVAIDQRTSSNEVDSGPKSLPSGWKVGHSRGGSSGHPRATFSDGRAHSSNAPSSSQRDELVVGIMKTPASQRQRSKNVSFTNTN